MITPDITEKICTEDNRVYAFSNHTMCGIRINNLGPDDTGDWQLQLMKLNDHVISIEFEVRIINWRLISAKTLDIFRI